MFNIFATLSLWIIQDGMLLRSIKCNNEKIYSFLLYSEISSRYDINILYARMSFFKFMSQFLCYVNVVEPGITILFSTIFLFYLDNKHSIDFNHSHMPYSS